MFADPEIRILALLTLLAFLEPARTADAQMQTGSSRSPYHLKWLDLTHEGKLQAGEFKFIETEPDPGTGQPRHDYIQGPGDKNPHEFYRNGRGIAVALVNQCRLLIVEDDYTTKLSKLVAINLDTFQQTEISPDAVERYSEETTADRHGFVNARALATSPDCSKALLEVRLTFSDAGTPEEARQAAEKYPPRWYTVKLQSGTVTSEWEGSHAPRQWY